MIRRVLIVSFHFYPSTAIGARRLSELARSLVDAGSKVTVLCSPPADAMRDSDLASRIEGCEVFYLREWFQFDALVVRLNALGARLLSRRRETSAGSGPSKPPSTSEEQGGGTRLRRVKRAIRAMLDVYDQNKLWTLRAALEVFRLRMKRRYDVVISSGPPFSPHFVARLSKLLFHIPWIIDYRDPWFYEDPADTQRHPSALRDAIEKKTESYCLQVADKVVTAAPGIVRNFGKYYTVNPDKVAVVLNGYDGPLYQYPPVTGRLVLLYAGTLYIGRNPFPLFEAISSLIAAGEVDRTKLQFVLVGDCATWNDIDLIAWTRNNGLDDVIDIRPPVKPTELESFYRQANVLVTFAQQQAECIPGKVYEYMAYRRENLVLTEADSDTAWLYRKASAIGTVVDPTGPEGPDMLRAAIRRYYDAYAVNNQIYSGDDALLHGFSRDRQNQDYSRLINAVCSR